MVKRFATRRAATAPRNAQVETEPARELHGTAPRPAADAKRTDRQNTVRGRRPVQRLLTDFKGLPFGARAYQP